MTTSVPSPIPTTCPTLRCPECDGTRRVMADIPNGVMHGIPQWRRAETDCHVCDGRGFLPYRRPNPVARGVAPVPLRL